MGILESINSCKVLVYQEIGQYDDDAYNICSHLMTSHDQFKYD